MTLSILITLSMNYLGFLLGLLTLGTLLYAAYVLFTERVQKRGPVLAYLQPAPAETLSSNKVKGDAFENYVMGKFSPTYFSAIEMRSDKGIPGMYPVSNTYPDLLLQFRHLHHSIRFAVECKYRSSLTDNAIQWARQQQIQNYYDYQNSKKIQVFVVIGIGGQPDHPKSLYVIPLKCIPRHFVFLSKTFLQPYAKSTATAFFLDTDTGLLK